MLVHVSWYSYDEMNEDEGNVIRSLSRERSPGWTLAAQAEIEFYRGDDGHGYVKVQDCKWQFCFLSGNTHFCCNEPELRMLSCAAATLDLTEYYSKCVRSYTQFNTAFDSDQKT